MAAEGERVEPADSEQDEEEDVYEVERIIDMRVEEGEVLYRVRWKNYCSDDDTWEPEAHLEDCREVLLAFKKNMADMRAKKEAEAKKATKPPAAKADDESESDSDKDRPTDAPFKKKKKKKAREEEEEEEADNDDEPRKERRKKKKKEKWKEELRPLPAPETDEEDSAPPPSPPKERRADVKKRLMDSDEEEDEPVPSKRHKKEKGKEGGRQKKEKGEEAKKRKGKRKIETSEDEATAPLEEDLSDAPSDPQMEEDLARSGDRTRPDDKPRQKKGKWEVKLQGIKELLQDKKVKRPDASLKESSLQKLKSLTTKSKEEAAPPSSDSSDSSSLHRKSKGKPQETTAPPSAPPSGAAAPARSKEDEVTKEEKDGKGSTNLFEEFLLNCEAKDRAPRRQPAHPPPPEKTPKPAKVQGKSEKIPKTKDSPAQRQEGERTRQSDVSRPGQSHGFSLDSDERDGEDPAAKSRPGEEVRERREKPEEAARPAWERRASTEDRKRRREDSEPRLFMACDDNPDQPDPLEGTDKSDKNQATLSLGMDLNLDWMTLDDFQKHLNGEDEILSGPPLSPSELRDAVKSGDYMAVKLALNSKEDYNLDQEACTIGAKRSFEGEVRLVEERSSSHALTATPSLDSTRNQEGAQSFKAVNRQKVRGPTDSESLPTDSAGTNCKQEAVKTEEQIQKGRKGMSEGQDTTCNVGTRQGKEATRQGERDVASDAASSSLSNASGLTFDLATASGGANHEGAAGQSSAEEANFSSDEAGDETAGPSDAAGRAAPERPSEDKAQAKARPRRKPYENMQPTRSSLRSCKKVFDMMESEEPEEIKEVAKKHFCLYCKMAFTQLAKHLERKHAEETEVAHAIHFPKGSKVRQTMLDQIRNKGDYEHNCKVLRKGEGETVTKKQVKSTTVSVRDYLPCQHCFAFYRKTDLWRHERSCKARKGDETSAETAKAGRVHPASSRLLPMSEFLTESCKEIIHSMHQDDISRLIRNDPLICKYGNALSAKYGHDKSQFAYIAQKMRELGRFLLAVTELDPGVKYLHEVCHPSKFELVVDGAKKASGFDPSSSTFKTVSLVSKIGYSLKRAAEIAFGESRMTEDRETEREVQNFIQLLDTKWSERFSRKSLASSLKQDVKKLEVDKSTVTEDLVKLHTFITGEEAEARRDLLESPSLSTWKKLSEATLADVCLFNRGRVGNIGRMLLNTYVSKKSRGVFVPSADQVRKSSKLELVLGGSFTRLELEGQYGRNMLVMLTERMVLSIDLLIENRENAGVSKSNPYLFARTEGPSFIRGLDCFRRAAVECGVKNPEALLSSSLREQISCCWQLMSLSEQELDQVAKLVGRSSQDCYTLPKNAPQLEEVSKELLQMDRTLLASPSGATTDGTALKTALKRRPWSEKEQTAVRRYLSDFITKMKVPGKKECNACIAAEPDLCGRSWTDIKNYVHNTLQTARRRSNQPKPEGVSVPKSSTAEVQTGQKSDMDDIPIARGLTSQLSDHIRESSNCCMSVAPLTNVRELAQYPQEMALSYTNLCSSGASMIHTTQPLMSSFTPLNATDTQVVPTFTPHNTTNALMSSPYTSENRILPMVPSYTQSATSMAPPSVYNPQDPASSMLPSYSPLSLPSTSMVPTFTSLSGPSAPMVPAFSPLNDRSRMVVSSFTPLNHPNTPAYPASPPRTSTTAQVVPTVIGHSVPDRAPPAQESSPMSTPRGKLTPPAVKAQKRNKRLWSGEEQAAVRRQFGDFCKLAKVPGKKDCDACLAAEPALSTRTWREVKYFVHNSIQSLKRRGQATVLKDTGPQEPETLAPNSEWDGPVYLSL